MACSHLVLAAIGFVLLAPVAVAFPHLHVTRLGEESKHYVSTSSESDLPRDIEGTTAEETRIDSSNETASTGPGTACNKPTHCATILVCLASGTCGCPDHVPVLVRDADSYACVSSRRLREFCLSDAECRHANKQTHCVDSLCRCQTDFYSSGDGCLPKREAWKPLKTTMFPAVLLILAFIVLAFVGYNRLSTDPDDKERVASGLPCSPRNISEFRIKNLRNLFKTWPFKALSIVGSRLRLFTLSATQMSRFLTSRQEWSRLEEDVSQSDESPNVVKHEAPYNAHDISAKRKRSGAFQWHTLNTSDASHRPLSSVQHVLLQGSTGALRQDKTSRRRAEESNNRTRNPTAMPRTRISTLSTFTLMPSRAGRRTNLNSSVASSATKVPVTNAYGYRDAGITDATQQDRAICSDDLQHLSPRPPTSYRFTESELSGGMLRKHRSELVRQPGTKQDRRAVSEGVDSLDVVDKEETMDYRGWYESSPTPSCWYSSEACDCSEWTADPWVSRFEDEDAKITDGWSLVNSTQPTWPCEHAERKLVDRRARTCEAFTVQLGSQPGTTKSAKGNEIVHQDVEMPQFIYSRWPPAQDRTRWRRRVLFSDNTTSASPRSPAATAAVQDNERPGEQLIGSGDGGGRRPAFMAEVATSRSDRNDPQEFRLPPPPRFNRATLSLDTRLATAMLRAERRAKGSSF